MYRQKEKNVVTSSVYGGVGPAELASSGARIRPMPARERLLVDRGKPDLRCRRTGVLSLRLLYGDGLDSVDLS